MVSKQNDEPVKIDGPYHDVFAALGVDRPSDLDVRRKAEAIVDQLWLDTHEKHKAVKLIVDAFAALQVEPVAIKPQGVREGLHPATVEACAALLEKIEADRREKKTTRGSDYILSCASTLRRRLLPATTAEGQ